MTAICALLFSCEMISREEGNGGLDIELKPVEAGSAAGNTFVSIKADGNWSLFLSDPDGGDVTWMSFDRQESVATKTGSGSVIVLAYYTANESGKARRINIVLDNGVRCCTASFIQYAEDEIEPDDPQPTPVMEDLSKRKGWLELPGLTDPTLEYHSHAFKMAVQDDKDPSKTVTKSIRNYSYGYSRTHYLAKWVAYPLCKLYTSGSASGGSGWNADPKVSSAYQADYTGSFGFRPWGYERGHQIPNADRKCSREANNQTYYFTNCTLQHDDFNGEIWMRLEDKLRAAANSADTCYMITGCVVDDDPIYIKDPHGLEVPVPAGYFKAAILYSKASTMNPWMGAAFYLDHRYGNNKYPYANVTETEIMTIEELEEKLGMKLFVNLSTKVGETMAASIKKQDPLTYRAKWGI